VIDRRGAIAALLSSPMLAKAGAEAKEVPLKSSGPGSKSRSLFVFKLNARVANEHLDGIRTHIRSVLDGLGINDPSILLPYELSLDVHEID
jgi:hypothetical protein